MARMQDLQIGRLMTHATEGRLDRFNLTPLMCAPHNSVPASAVHVGGDFICALCRGIYDDDVYDCSGFIVCGRCRYIKRHGRRPRYYTRGACDLRYGHSEFSGSDEWGGSETLHRFQHVVCLTMREYQIHQQIDIDSTASLDK